MSGPGSSRQPPTGEDYEVGYGRPPVGTRFKLGDIGNPKGRPRKKKTVGQTLQEALMMRIRLEVNGRWKTMTAQELMIQNLVRSAARGNTRDMRLVFALIDRYQDSPETTLNLTELESEDRKILEEYLAMQTKGGTDSASEPPADNTDQDTDENKPTDGKPTDKSEDSDGGAT
jgi:hypothetical protein